MEVPIDFKSVTTSGVAQTKNDKAITDAAERARRAREYSDIKSSMAPPKQEANNAEKALKKLYLQQSVNKISGKEETQEAPAQDPETERLNLIKKLSAYYTLERFRGRNQLTITAKTTNEAIKAEIYDIENETTEAGPELVLLSLFKTLEIAERWSDRGKNALGIDLGGLHDNARENQDKLVPLAQEISIKYMDLMPRMGVWGRLATCICGIGYHTHKYNTDPEYRKQIEAYREAEKQAEDMQRKLNEQMEKEAAAAASRAASSTGKRRTEK